MVEATVGQEGEGAVKVSESAPVMVEKKEMESFMNLFFEGRAFQAEENVAAMRHLAVTHVTTGLELGQRLLVHRHNLAHGEFEKDLGRIGLEPRMAEIYMFVAKRFGPVGKGEVAGLSLRKMLTFARELSPDQIRCLSDKKRLTDPDLGRSAEELRAMLRGLRKALEQQELTREELEARIAELRAEREGKGEDVSRLQRLVARAVVSLGALRDYVSHDCPKDEMLREGPEAIERLDEAFAHASIAFDERGAGEGK